MITIERVTLTDLPQLEGLYRQLMNAPTDLERMRETFAVINASPDYILIGAKKDGLLVGSILGIICHDLARECRPFFVLENVIVDGEHHRMGIGKLMMEYLERYAEERHCAYILLVSGPTRKEAHKFYADLGYAEEGALGFRKHLE